MDISNELKNNSEIKLYRCSNCKVKFFYPPLSGSGEFYARLQNLPWYYLEDKWEYKVALKDLMFQTKVMEIGCGIGEFLISALENGVDIEGIDLNEKAVKYAQKRGLPATKATLQNILKSRDNYYDAVCLFQVLEHVSDPQDFLSDTINLIKKGGALIISVPNGDSFIQYDQNNLLDQPPHHVTRWNTNVFIKLQNIFPISLKKIDFEPLAEYHLDWYFSIQLYRLSKFSTISSFNRRIIHDLVLFFAKKTKIYRYFRGHSLYIQYQKT